MAHLNLTVAQSYGLAWDGIAARGIEPKAAPAQLANLPTYCAFVCRKAHLFAESIHEDAVRYIVADNAIIMPASRSRAPKPDLWTAARWFEWCSFRPDLFA